ncbi:phosphoadenosine phosphosulfate reductase family protein [Roseiconus lacunae]|uniref:Phosphoadenosine phosphosulfate reductase family protein n=1 Tax=Roseiconus lacunae TaxID=2605694 RepID=A0ABT7PF69_9BACT|nr:phosphoadenosine phosphosulfate reductase family protein [Roseiconus lacunae]MDM4014944.1 phosphoadenosine phosphosulfate reductase family protein [Roseiconus lacunae]
MTAIKQPTLFADARSTIQDSINQTIESLLSHAVTHPHWVIAWSGGKDSTALLAVVLYLVESGKVPKPERLTVCYADTRMELPPLAISARKILQALQRRGIETQVVMAPIDKRFYVYILGRGVPPPNNNTLRWCTRQIKVEPMQKRISELVAESNDVLMLTGVRQGESAIRDGRIQMSCGVNGAECGQGWYQQMSGDGFATLAPLLHWRVCHVWEWLRILAPSKRYGGLDTRMVADAYGGEEAEEVNARTGCNGCPLASRDTALDSVLALPQWSHLSPLKELRPLYRELREPQNRLRKPAGEKRKDGTLVGNQNRMGPLTLNARRYALAKVIDIQERINFGAEKLGRDRVDFLNTHEISRIEELIEANTWPNRWTGEEPLASEPFGDALELFNHFSGE